MKKIAGYVLDYFREEWNTPLFMSVALLLAASFAINYGYDFETTMIRQFADPVEQLVFYFLFFSLPYVITIALHSFFTGKRHLPDTRFNLLLLACFVLIAVYILAHNIPGYIYRTSPDLFTLIPTAYHWYIVRLASNLLPGFVVLLPLAWYWLRHDRASSRFYGFSSSHIELKTYFIILAFLVPLIFLASLSPDFRSAYPRYKFGLPQVGGSEQVLLVAGFEVCYGFDFVLVELLFRGFMVMAFTRYLGSGAILPMVVVYVFIHFQKPMGEALSSIVGGLVLGVISYRTKSIYGGIILHLGVAFMMEIAGALQLLF